MSEMTRIMVFILALATWPAMAWAAESAMRFDLSLLGLRAGTIDMAAKVTETAYAARSRFRTAGLIALLKRVRGDATVRGAVIGGGLRPQSYAEAINDGDRVSDVKVRFRPFPPRLIAGDTGSDAPPVDPARLKEALDPLTGLYLALRDQPRAGLCRLSVDVFDGQRLARLVLDEREERGARVICRGAYRRVAGYERDSGRARRVPLTIEYAGQGDIMRAERVSFDTRYGHAVMARR